MKAMESRQDHDIPALSQCVKPNYEAPLTSDPLLRNIPQSYWVVFHSSRKVIAHNVVIGFNI